VPLDTPPLGQSITHALVLININVHTKFERVASPFKDMIGPQNFTRNSSGDSERELFYDDIIHSEANAYAH